MTSRRYILAFEFQDGTAYVADTQDPKRFAKVLRRVWPNEPPPRAWIADQYTNYFSTTSNVDKAIQRCRAVILARRLRSGGSGDGNVGVYTREIGSFSEETFEYALHKPWHAGNPFIIDGVTSPLTTKWKIRRHTARLLWPISRQLAKLRYRRSRPVWLASNRPDLTISHVLSPSPPSEILITSDDIKDLLQEADDFIREANEILKLSNNSNTSKGINDGPEFR